MHFFFQINTLDEATRKLRFLTDILSPTIEAYSFVASSLMSLHENNSKINNTSCVGIHNIAL